MSILCYAAFVLCTVALLLHCPYIQPRRQPSARQITHGYQIHVLYHFQVLQCTPKSSQCILIRSWFQIPIVDILTSISRYPFRDRQTAEVKQLSMARLKPISIEARRRSQILLNFSLQF
ncbi:hypothetical protein R3P38DRAFT_3045597 [Favolaschia claudopus]|uniref:Secreted protein n=1 Tax=Favolaschia claudopus TaxID=2862362 RepID=A0AAW0A6N4_9AGAR